MRLGSARGSGTTPPAAGQAWSPNTSSEMRLAARRARTARVGLVAGASRIGEGRELRAAGPGKSHAGRVRLGEIDQRGSGVPALVEQARPGVGGGRVRDAAGEHRR